MLALRHLERIGDVFESTGHLWENYCSEKSAPGSWAGKDYSWTVLGPLALLLEVIIGVEPDACANMLYFDPPENEDVGVENIAMGAATINILRKKTDGEMQTIVNTDREFTLALNDGKRCICKKGETVL